MSVTTDTVIVGAGPAGLAVAACLRRAGCDFEIIERADAVGSAWRSHYDRLHLHTDKAHSRLPFRRYPAEYPKYPSREQFVSYLDDYARHFGIAPRFGLACTSLAHNGSSWKTRTDDIEFSSRNIVVATGNTREPNIPTWPGLEAFRGRVLHSSDYRNPEPFRGERVLVVGCGNSGGEIALDLCQHGVATAVSVRSATNVLPRELFGVPVLAIAVAATKLPTRLADLLTAPILRLKFGRLEKLGLRKLPYGPLAQIKRDRQIPLIDIGTIDLMRSGKLEVREGVRQFDGGDVEFADGRRDTFDSVICATGFQPAVDAFLSVDGILDMGGSPVRSGVETSPGLYFCGFYVSPTGMLREIAGEAKRIARAIARPGAAA